MAVISDSHSDPKAAARSHGVGGLGLDRLVLYAVAGVLVVLLTWPFFWAVSSSMKDAGEIYIRPPRWLPETPRFINYVEVWYVVPFGRFLWNSVVVTVLSMVGQVISATAVANSPAIWASPRQKWRMRSR